MRLCVLLMVVLLAGCAPNYAGQYLAQFPDTPPDIVAAIKSNQIKKGMTKNQVKAAWGEPTRISNLHYAGTNADSWAYHSEWDRYQLRGTTVFFTNGSVVGWSD